MITNQRFAIFATAAIFLVIAALLVLVQNIGDHWQQIDEDAAQAIQSEQVERFLTSHSLQKEKEQLHFQVNNTWPAFQFEDENEFRLVVNQAQKSIEQSHFNVVDFQQAQQITQGVFFKHLLNTFELEKNNLPLVGFSEIDQQAVLLVINDSLDKQQLLVSGLFLNQASLERINGVFPTELVIDFVSLSDLNETSLKFNLSINQPYVLANEQKAPSLWLKGVLGQNAIEIKTTNALSQANPIIANVGHAIKRTQQEYKYVAIILIATLAVFMFLLWSLRKYFISPISDLAAEVANIKPNLSDTHSIDLGKTAKNDDHISALAQSINVMLAELFAAKEFKRVALNSIGDAVITTDLCGRVTYMNQAASILIKAEFEKSQGKHVADILPFTERDDINKIKEILDEVLCQGNETNLSRITHKLNRELEVLYVEKHITLLKDQKDQATGSVMVLRDVTQSERLKKKLNFQANYDAVTKLLNRHKYEELLTEAFYSAKDKGRQHVLCQLDLDRFKLINDSAGHAAGDQLLYEIGGLIKTYIRKSDICARIGGDEFAIILYDANLNDSLKLLGKLVSQIKDYRFIWGGRLYSIGASFGVTLITKESIGIPEVRREADAACYMAKSLGQNNIRVFDSNNENLNSHHQAPRWASRINDALVNDKFQLFFQRIAPTNSSSKEKEHIEILLRLEDEAQGLLSPGMFLPAAERFRLTPKIDRWVIRSVFRWLMARPELWDKVLLCINLSGESLTDSELYDFIVSLHSRVAFPPQAICFEVTETAAVANLVVARELIQKLKSYGFTFALDDFGKGFSSYSYLQNLPAEFVKIDGDFVRKMTSNKGDREIVRSIHEISHVMGMKTIAEYVEDEETFDALKELGVNYAQGFGIQRPQSLKSFVLVSESIH
ncbi:EAL domain-containing protein [Catenovulum sp. SM1970]|uniref:EAL domain-containing protein n=1 Tax=Marinifaba aquimaris TaxID=2741323 RepID=UPI00157448A2|nr:EAL domain-containing protein [Marinifaba aquimaris]NTS77874.1 EAL domain-containing protein [Marinifaba aquimaris]